MQNRKSISLAIASAFALTGGLASTSLFAATDLASGYMVASAGDAKAAEAKCGDKKAEAKCGDKKAAEAKCGDKKAEHKCGDKGSNCEKGAKAGECVCGAAKGKKADGKCGEGKCGAKK